MKALSSKHSLYAMAAFLAWLVPGLVVAQDRTERSMICKAAIATAMGRDPAIIRANDSTGDAVSLSYRRPDDQKLWSYRCRISGNRVIWAADPGRWRDLPGDGRLTYLQDQARIYVTETYDDGSKIEKSFPKEKLK